MRKPFSLKGVSRRTATVFLACAMIGLGVWQIGQAGYIHLKAKVAQVLVQDAWAETLAGQSQVRPWPWADTWPVARLQIPELGIQI